MPMKMEPIASSETSTVRTQTPGNYPKRNKLHLEHGESLKAINGSCFSGTRTHTRVLLCQSATECAFYRYKFSVLFNIRDLLTPITHSFWKKLTV